MLCSVHRIGNGNSSGSMSRDDVLHAPTIDDPRLPRMAGGWTSRAIDLGWTTVNSGNAHFQEMNPLGSRILLDGNALTLFKLSSVLASLTLLFVLRKYKGAQLASWCVCMICTLVTFRWIILDSAVLG